MSQIYLDLETFLITGHVAVSQGLFLGRMDRQDEAFVFMVARRADDNANPAHQIEAVGWDIPLPPAVVQRVRRLGLRSTGREFKSCSR